MEQGHERLAQYPEDCPRHLGGTRSTHLSLSGDEAPGRSATIFDQEEKSSGSATILDQEEKNRKTAD